MDNNEKIRAMVKVEPTLKLFRYQTCQKTFRSHARQNAKPDNPAS
jgi:hypothetical protein